jgi:adenine-specific DNA-methyltransferase
MLDLAGYTTDCDLPAERVVEPSVGDGAFWGPLVERLVAARGDTDWAELTGCLRGWDLQADKVEICQKLTVTVLTEAGCPTETAEALSIAWLHTGDFLLSDRGDYRASLVVGNPPYIRIEDLPSHMLVDYRAACPTMGGRADIFVGFIEHGLDLLEPDGKLVYICADRWMRNDYGADLRKKVVSAYSMDTVLVMHDVDAFESDVSAYPAITVTRSGKQGSVVTADMTANFGANDVPGFLAWAKSKKKALHTPAVTAGRLHAWHDSGDLWPTGSADTLAWLDDLHKRFHPLELSDRLTMLRIGVATGNDKVFIPDTVPDVEPDRLTPIARSEDFKDGRFVWSGQQLVDPWLNTDAKGRDALMIRADHPKTFAYFDSQAASIPARQTKNGRYKTIDRVWHKRVENGFLVLEDMKANASPVLIPPGYYPHHNLYAIFSTAWDLKVLGGLLLSEVFERQIAAFCVKMRGGTLRFQAQYVRRCRFPRPADVPADVAADLADAFERRDRDAATKSALRAYGMDSLPA